MRTTLTLKEISSTSAPNNRTFNGKFTFSIGENFQREFGFSTELSGPANEGTNKTTVYRNESVFFTIFVGAGIKQEDVGKLTTCQRIFSTFLNLAVSFCFQAIYEGKDLSVLISPKPYSLEMKISREKILELKSACM